jgi:hypothetical protein
VFGLSSSSYNAEVKRKLQAHTDAAREEASLSRKQMASIERSKNRANNAKTQKERDYHLRRAESKKQMYMGTQIDTIFKRRVESDTTLGLSVTARGKFGPDVYNSDTKQYWDLTTEKGWNKGTHQNKYDKEFGTGVGIFWD